MPNGPAQHPRLVASLLLTACVAVIGLVLLNSGALAPSSYDSLHQLSPGKAGALTNSPVVLVYLDLNSFNVLTQDPTRPWPRRLHAQLLRKLTAAGARAVVFDVVFSAPSDDAAADNDLATALRESGRAILAGESSGKISHRTSGEQDWARASTISQPFRLFATNASAWGIASHIIDDDYVVRRHLAGFSAEVPSLTWATAVRLQLPVTQTADAMERFNRSELRYYGPPLTLPHVSYAEALAQDGTPQDFFRDKIVFIGARPITELFRGRQDEFRSPFHSWANRELFMPGVEVHSTEMLNLLRDDALNRLPWRLELILVLLVAMAFGGGFIWLRPIPATVVALAGSAGALGLSLAAFSRDVWFPWLIVSAAQMPAALGGSVLFNSLEWYRARKRFG